MLVICESGSTKADWVLLDKNNKTYTETIGINPLFHDIDKIKAILQSNSDLVTHQSAVTKIFFYGTSCSSAERISRVKTALQAFFTNAQLIEVRHDLDGAAYSVARADETSIVNIIGTGSNSCLFDGTKIIDQIGGNGFILSDEASGAYFGKRICGDYLIKMIPADMRQYIEQDMAVTRDIIMNNVYREPNANVYLASFSKLLSHFASNEYVQNLINSGFNEFYKKHICRFHNYADYPVHFIGSIAFYFKENLASVSIKNNAQLGNIIQKPIEGLIQYHQSEVEA
ncbi:MAG: hypothetical protein WCP57_10885 [Bacteroidota bacterium]